MNENIVKNYNIIVAMCKNGGIGKDDKMPWNINEDMNYFTKQTKGNGNNAVIMGRNTWNSIPNKYLKGRDNFILSSTIIMDEVMDDGHILKTFKTFEEANTFFCSSTYDTIWIIGGSIVYKEFLERNVVNKCYITYINSNYVCDTFFDGFDTNKWLLTDTKAVITSDHIKIDFIEFIYKG